MEKIRFIIVGSGWRSLYYVRIAKALPEKFELCAMLCRTPEKAEKMRQENDIYTTTSIEECRNMKPDFVVVVVNKASIAEVSKEWMDYGFTVLCETPAAQDLSVLKELWEYHRRGKRLVVAEQYCAYATYKGMQKLIDRGMIGTPQGLNISLAHEYHGASLMRMFLQEAVATPFMVSAKRYEFETVETLSRYECFTDGRTALKKRTVATFEFEDGKVAWYDFDSEQYRSPIRHKYIRLRGTKGELSDNELFYLDEKFMPNQAKIKISDRDLSSVRKNPNGQKSREVVKIVLQKEAEEELLYEAIFGCCNLTEDETAIATLMLEAAEYQKAWEMIEKQNGAGKVLPENGKAGSGKPTGSQEKSLWADAVVKRQKAALQNALQDSYMAILLQEAIVTGEKVMSQSQIWQK